MLSCALPSLVIAGALSCSILSQLLGHRIPSTVGEQAIRLARYPRGPWGPLLALCASTSLLVRVATLPRLPAEAEAWSDPIPAGTWSVSGPVLTEVRDQHATEWTNPDGADITVQLTQPYRIMRTEVTNGLWQEVWDRSPERAKAYRLPRQPSPYLHPGYPVIAVSWCMALRFANLWSELDLGADAAPYRLENGNRGLEGCAAADSPIIWDRAATGYRLPTEAEWEVAARANTRFRWSGSDDSTAVAWHRHTSAMRPHQVASLLPNPWRLHDMSGNLWEWVWDPPTHERVDGAVDPPQIDSRLSQRAVARGGDWDDPEDRSCVACRAETQVGTRSMEAGFRLVAPVAAEGPRP